MKRVRVTILADYVLPDDWEIIDADDDSFECLRGEGRSFTPDLCWLEAGPGTVAGDPVRWNPIDDERNHWFTRRLQEMQFSVEPA